MLAPQPSKLYQIYCKSCYGLSELAVDSIDALATDPPYGISFQAHYWDKDLPDPQIWVDCLRVLKPGAFGVVFSSIRLMHHLMVNLEDAGFLIKDVLMWAYLNGMPKSRNIGVEIDKTLGVESRSVGQYNYVQGYKKEGADNYYAMQGKLILEPESELGRRYQGAGLGLKPAYEPIILIQKPLVAKLTVAENVIQFGTGVLNITETRLPLAENESPVGHNPHPDGRVMANVLRTEPFEDGYDKFFLVPKVRQHKDTFNNHPTLKPVALMAQLVSLISFEGQAILDPFMGSGSSGVAAAQLHRHFYGYELEETYFNIATQRLRNG